MINLQKRIDDLTRERAHALDVQLQQAFADAIESLSNLQSSSQQLDQTATLFSDALTDLWRETKDLLARSEQEVARVGAQRANSDQTLKLVVITTRGSLEVIQVFRAASDTFQRLLTDLLENGLLSEEESHQAVEAAKRAFAALWEAVALFGPVVGPIMGAISSTKTIIEALTSNPDYEAWKRVSERLAFLRALPALALGWITGASAIAAWRAELQPGLVQRAEITQHLLNP